MLRIYRAADLPQAYLLKRLLEDAGVACRILNENAQGGLGEIPFTHTYPEIWLIRESDASLARKLLDDFEKQGDDSGTTISCASCQETNPSNFETCWNCGALLGTDPE